MQAPKEEASSKGLLPPREGGPPPPLSVTAKRVRVSIDAKSGTAMVTLQRDGVTVQRNLVKATSGFELDYLFPPTGADPQPHEYVLTVTGDAVAILGGSVQSPPIKLTVDTTEEELQLPESEGAVE